MLGVGVALLAATLVPTASVFADALNPLTERSLLLSSSAPGWQNTDGSGNSADAPNAIGENYAPAGSGPNGQRTGETFTFTTSSSSNIQAFTLQYCTKAAGLCQAPGNNAGDADPDRDSGTNDSTRDTNAEGFAASPKTSDLDFVGAFTQTINAAPTAGQFQVYVDDVISTEAWTFEKANNESQNYPTGAGNELTGKNNFVTLKSTNGLQINNGQEVKIVFVPSEQIYITNPGEGAFFVKINTFNSATSQIGAHNDPTPLDETDHTIVDGGVTVANVMTDSIHITTKVLETMAFSVGTQNPDTQAVQHGSCDAITVQNNNRLNLGSPTAEYSLETGQAYDTHSYWRLSSNSSGGATVYYSGDTLRNTVGDFIKPIGANAGNLDDGGKAHSQPGTEQFGLALVDAGADTPDPEGLDTDGTNDFPTNWSLADIAPLTIESDYADGDAAPISNGTTANGGATTDNAQFAFKKSSLTNPVVIAQNNNQVLSCATAKVRYVGNIAADTPAGVYTTKINYLAAPQY
jgi:hypothetical protein